MVRIDFRSAPSLVAGQNHVYFSSVRSRIVMHWFVATRMLCAENRFRVARLIRKPGTRLCKKETDRRTPD